MYPINNMLGDTSSQSSRIYTPYSPPSYSPYSLPPYSSYPHQPPACNDVCPVKRNEDQNSTKNTCSVIGPIVNVAQCVAGALLGNPSNCFSAIKTTGENTLNCVDQRRWGIAVISNYLYAYFSCDCNYDCQKFGPFLAHVCT